MKPKWREKGRTIWVDPVGSKVIATVITVVCGAVLAFLYTVASGYFWPSKPKAQDGAPAVPSSTHIAKPKGPDPSTTTGPDSDRPAGSKRQSQQGTTAANKQRESAPTVIEKPKTLFIDCRMGTMPSAVAAPGRVYALLTSHLPLENGGGGLAEYFSTSATGGEFAWTNDKSPAWAYRCDVTNYADEVLVDVVMSFMMTFRKPLEVPGQPNALKQGEVTLDRPWPITIAKIDRGPESPFTFYVWNCCVDRFVKVRALPEAVAQGNGPMRLEVRQSATNLYQEVNPTSLWLKGVR